MSKRVLVIVDRSMTDKTPKLVWEHEKRLLEEVHGCSVIDVDPSTLDAMPMDHYGIGEDFKCSSIEDEYFRLGNVYGMHPQVQVSIVEHVYGRLEEGRFEKVLGKDPIAKDEFDLKPTSTMLMESVELDMWKPGIKKELWSYEDLMKAAKVKGIWKKDKTLRESLIALMRARLADDAKQEAA